MCVGLQGLAKVTDADFFARFTYKVLCQHHLLQQKLLHIPVSCQAHLLTL